MEVDECIEIRFEKPVFATIAALHLETAQIGSVVCKFADDTLVIKSSAIVHIHKLFDQMRIFQHHKT